MEIKRYIPPLLVLGALATSTDANASSIAVEVNNAFKDGKESGLVIDLPSDFYGLAADAGPHNIDRPRSVFHAQVIPPTPDVPVTQTAETRVVDFNFRALPSLSGESVGRPDTLGLYNFTVYGYFSQKNDENIEMYKWYYLRLPTGENAWIRNDGITLLGDEQAPDLTEAYNYLISLGIFNQDGSQVVDGYSTINVDAVQQFMNSLRESGYPPDTLNPGVLDLFIDSTEEFYLFKQTRAAGVNPEGSIYVARLNTTGQYDGAQFIPPTDTSTVLEGLGYPTEVDFLLTEESGILSVNDSGVSMNVRALFDNVPFEETFTFTPPQEGEPDDSTDDNDVDSYPPISTLAPRWFLDSPPPSLRPDIIMPSLPANYWENQGPFILNAETVPYGYLGHFDLNVGSYTLGYEVFAGQITECIYSSGAGSSSYTCGILLPREGGTNIIIHQTTVDSTSSSIRGFNLAPDGIAALMSGDASVEQIFTMQYDIHEGENANYLAGLSANQPFVFAIWDRGQQVIDQLRTGVPVVTDGNVALSLDLVGSFPSAPTPGAVALNLDGTPR